MNKFSDDAPEVLSGPVEVRLVMDFGPSIVGVWKSYFAKIPWSISFGTVAFHPGFMFCVACSSLGIKSFI